MLNKVLENVSTIAIGGHIRPDGDCVGSCVGLGQDSISARITVIKP